MDKLIDSIEELLENYTKETNIKITNIEIDRVYNSINGEHIRYELSVTIKK